MCFQHCCWKSLHCEAYWDGEEYTKQCQDGDVSDHALEAVGVTESPDSRNSEYARRSDLYGKSTVRDQSMEVRSQLR